MFRHGSSQQIFVGGLANISSVMVIDPTKDIHLTYQNSVQINIGQEKELRFVKNWPEYSTQNKWLAAQMYLFGKSKRSKRQEYDLWIKIKAIWWPFFSKIVFPNTTTYISYLQSSLYPSTHDLTENSERYLVSQFNTQNETLGQSDCNERNAVIVYYKFQYAWIIWSWRERIWCWPNIDSYIKPHRLKDTFESGCMCKIYV